MNNRNDLDPYQMRNGRFFIAIFVATFAPTLIGTYVACTSEGNSIIAENQTQQVLTLRDAKYFRTEAEAMLYAKEGLTEYADAFMRLSENDDFKEILYDEMAREFDGDFNVLITDLIDACNDQEFYIEDTLLLLVEDFDLEKFLDIFMDIDGVNNYYAQIHIPNFDSIEYLNRDVVAAVFYGDDSITSYAGYVIDAPGMEGQLDSIVVVDEAYTENNEVWVFSINERVDNDGHVPTSVPDDHPEAPEDSIEFRSTVSFQIDKITIKDRFENALGGRSEINMRANLEYYDGLHPINHQPTSFVSDRSSNDFKGHNILCMRRRDLNDEFEVDYNMQTGWLDEDFFGDPVVYQFVVFEYDSWPNGIKVRTTMVPEGEVKVYQFRSHQDEIFFIGSVFSTIPPPSGYTSDVYPNGIPSSLHADGFEFISSDIVFNTEYY